MHRRGIIISLVRYADSISANPDIIEVAANLDVIKPRHEQRSYDRCNQPRQLLAFHGLAHLVKPGHHLLDNEYWLQRYLDDGHDFICLGGMVDPRYRRFLRTWVDHIFTKYLTNPDGTPKVKLDGFGLTTVAMLKRYLGGAWIVAHGGMFHDAADC